ncbi:ABC transporter substrate-binding protein [Acinetobacter sp. V91_7]|uniref:ABC transporter substrate-binding protein n=1 Tax=Acinetobacter TaxID=469 RepID=UPI002275767C|nr:MULTISPECIES: ABC transporter substrate-binding protein [Acinetobacter]MDS7935990.1 ABC transporter substrate-binding protein [Acinetobacter sp. V91_4B]MDS7964402.1 ABC transporter substrate-binding protein [Acinetobacter sp. V91_7]MDS8026323.1 ABC transporter substrate-binding protein [Acinetobacter sp. V91_13]GLG83269.1 ABC transporter substrate-binding protein [Acinetobacter calcoaceticus]
MTNQTFQLSRRKFLTQSLTALGGVSLMGSLSGCSPSPDNSTESNSTSSATPKHGGVIRLGLIGGQQSGSLDPHLSASGSGITRGFAIYNKLWEWDENMLPRLALAEFAEPNHNASEWTIRLRKGLEFHHGKTITADDVIFSVKRLTDPKLASPFRNLVQWIDRDRIQKLDEYTVRIPFISTIPGFVALPETWVNFGGIVPTDFDPIHNPVGAGPYKVKEFIPGQRSVFTRFNNYFKADKPYADSFEVIDFKDQVSRLNALLAGQIDVANAISPEYIKILEQAKHIQTIRSATNTHNSFDFNTQQAPFNDPRVRQAFRLIANREELVQRGLNGQGRIANDLYSPQDPAFLNLPQRQQNIAEAKNLLAQAGFKEGLSVELVTPVSSAQPALIFAEQAKQANVNIRVKQVDFATFNGPDRSKWQLSSNATNVGTPYLSTAVVNDAPISTTNRVNFKDPEYSELFFKALAEPDLAKRKIHLAQAQKIQHERGGMLIWGFSHTIDAAAKDIGGLAPEHTIFPTWRFEKLWKA